MKATAEIENSPDFENGHFIRIKQSQNKNAGKEVNAAPEGLIDVELPGNGQKLTLCNDITIYLDKIIPFAETNDITRLQVNTSFLHPTEAGISEDGIFRVNFDKFHIDPKELAEIKGLNQFYIQLHFREAAAGAESQADQEFWAEIGERLQHRQSFGPSYEFASNQLYGQNYIWTEKADSKPKVLKRKIQRGQYKEQMIGDIPEIRDHIQKAPYSDFYTTTSEFTFYDQTGYFRRF